jgi:hypothetical protein
VFYQEAETRIASASLGEAFNRPFACYPSTLLPRQDAFRRFWLELPRAFWPYPLNASMRLSKLTPALSKLMPTTSDLCKASISGNVCGRCCSFFAVRRVAEALLHPVAFVFL